MRLKLFRKKIYLLDGLRCMSEKMAKIKPSVNPCEMSTNFSICEILLCIEKAKDV